MSSTDATAPVPPPADAAPAAEQPAAEPAAATEAPAAAPTANPPSEPASAAAPPATEAAPSSDAPAAKSDAPAAKSEEASAPKEAAKPPAKAAPGKKSAATPPSKSTTGAKKSPAPAASAQKSAERQRFSTSSPGDRSPSAAAITDEKKKKDLALRATYREKYTKHADPAHMYKPGPPPPPYKAGPPLPKEVEDFAKMTPAQRVKAAYAEIKKEQRPRAASSTFKSRTPRTSYGLVIPDDTAPKTPWQLRRDKLLEERQTKLKATIARTEANPKKEEKFKRSSSWARDTVERGTYMFNWQQFPETVPKRHADPNPGPGTYTGKLFFMGR